MSTAPLTLRQTELDGTTVLEIHGPLRDGSTPTLERRLALLLVQLRSPLIIDLAGVGDCDPVGAAVLVGAGRAASRATPVRLARPGGPALETLRAVGVLRIVPTFATVGDAIRADPSELMG
jgi:anti-anti-sigma regulatory factor